MKILANDGIADAAIKKLNDAGFEVSTVNVPQDQLVSAINSENYSALLVRSATKVRQDLIDACPGLKLIGRGGVGMDNIDVEYARSKNIHVINTPAASSQSVAELVMGELFSLSRSLYDAHRNMPDEGSTNFKSLKKAYSKGQELRGKTIGIVGFGRIGQSLASYALGIGMKVIPVDVQSNTVEVPVNIYGVGTLKAKLTPLNNLIEVIGELDYISVHIPKQKNGAAVIDEDLISRMKPGVIVVNAARGGVIDENALLKGLDSGQIAGAALDVFENEPTPNSVLLKHNKIASTPHIGAATVEAQDRIGLELAEQIIKYLK
ncbi:D-2-hydroxyacid dehydrogenase [Crocinitomix algicola]|uniref:D-2-hydroxyacid dehydrogenase n=1 Tax=Crocinitomix algicola TaxID=1740263 RepID=UPI00082C7617|nr:D-2-hydroxyacid dehydrogenase [Crocinitomix algicola]